jgi:uncharacterized membrane protein YhaH (DUF805 family)
MPTVPTLEPPPRQGAPRSERAERLDEVSRKVRMAFWVLALGVVCVFAFFVALGAVHPGEVAGLTISMALLAALWTVHAWLTRRVEDHRDPQLTRARERRGF